MARRAIDLASDWLKKNTPAPRLKQEGGARADSHEAIAAARAERKKMFERHASGRGRTSGRS